jgi:hypothetical protein
MPESLTFCGRTFGAGELELMRQTAQEFSALGVTEIARTVCELLEWTRPNGGLKNHECRQLLGQLQTQGFLRLPAVRKLGGRGPRRADLFESRCEPAPVHRAAGECEPLELVCFRQPCLAGDSPDCYGRLRGQGDPVNDGGSGIGDSGTASTFRGMARDASPTFAFTK